MYYKCITYPMQNVLQTHPKCNPFMSNLLFPKITYVFDRYKKAPLPQASRQSGDAQHYK